LLWVVIRRRTALKVVVLVNTCSIMSCPAAATHAAHWNKCGREIQVSTCLQWFF
jgi:hypothetical protein